MGAYKAAIVTQGGQNLIAQALAGDKTLAFTNAKTSEHIYPVGTNITALTGLQDIMQSAQISSSKVLNDTAVQVSVRFDNDGVTQQYRINTIGVYAQPEEGQEILFAVIQAVTPDEMPVQSEVSPSAFIYNIQFAVRNASQITLLVNPAGVATLQDILDVRQEIIDIEIPEFEDYSSEGVKVPDAREAIANIKSKTKLKVILSNVKAALMGLVTLGEMRGLLVNHGLCTEPGKFFLDAAYGKTLTDMVTQLNSDHIEYWGGVEDIEVKANTWTSCKRFITLPKGQYLLCWHVKVGPSSIKTEVCAVVKSNPSSPVIELWNSFSSMEYYEKIHSSSCYISTYMDTDFWIDLIATNDIIAWKVEVMAYQIK